MNTPDEAIEAAAEALNVAGVRALSGAHSLYRRGIARRAIEAAMPAIREAIAQELIKNGPVLNYELNYDGTEDSLRAAYVEGHRDAVGIVRGGTP